MPGGLMKRRSIFAIAFALVAPASACQEEDHLVFEEPGGVSIGGTFLYGSPVPVPAGGIPVTLESCTLADVKSRDLHTDAAGRFSVSVPVGAGSCRLVLGDPLHLHTVTVDVGEATTARELGTVTLVQ